jgi:hypothetical protein
MAHTDGVRALKYIVNKALWIARREQSDYNRFFQLAVDGLKELRLNYIHEGAAFARLTVPTTVAAVSFPSDLVEFLGIGVPVNGELKWLTPKQDMVITTTTVGGQETQDSDYGEGVDVIPDSSSGLYARGGVNIDGYYKIDHQNRRIFLNSVTATEVVIRYISSGTETTGTTFVPIKYESVLMAYIIWNDCRYDESRLQIAQYYEQQFNRESVNIDGYTIEELLDTLRSTYTMLPLRG